MDMKDYYKKDVIKKCSVCEKIVMVDQYGNGVCDNCGWVQDNVYNSHPDIVTYPNLVSLNKAKKLYAEGMQILPSIEDFLDALFMYSEMTFLYEGTEYEVCLSGSENETIIKLTSSDFSQNFWSREDFVNKAKIDGCFLRDVWYKVANIDFMN